MSPALLASLLIVAVVGLLALAEKLRVPSSLMLLGGGAAAALLPGLPDGRALDPHLILGLVLPALLYSSMVETSWALVRRQAVRGLVLGVALHVAVVAAVAVVAQPLLPGLGWSGAALLGVVLAVTDTRLAQETGCLRGVPRRITDALRGQEVVAPLVLLSLFQVLSDTPGQPPDAGEIAGRFARDWLFGGLVGLLLGLAIVQLRRWIAKASVEVAVSLATPFAAAALADALQTSVVVLIAVAALMVSRASVDRSSGATLSTPRARMMARHFWGELRTVLSGALAFLIGFALPDALGAVTPLEVGRVLIGTVALLAAAAILQFAVALAATGLPPRAAGARGGEAAVTAALPGRAALGLLIALAIPPTLPDGARYADRDLILLVASAAVVISTLLHLIALPPLLRRLELAGAGEPEEIQAAQQIVGAPETDQAALARARTGLLALRQRDAIGDEQLLEWMERLDLRAAAGVPPDGGQDGHEEAQARRPLAAREAG